MMLDTGYWILSGRLKHRFDRRVFRDPESKEMVSSRGHLDPGSRPVAWGLAGMTNCGMAFEVEGRVEGLSSLFFSIQLFYFSPVRRAVLENGEIGDKLHILRLFEPGDPLPDKIDEGLGF
jgi:hypothetical protein